MKAWNNIRIKWGVENKGLRVSKLTVSGFVVFLFLFDFFFLPVAIVFYSGNINVNFGFQGLIKYTLRRSTDLIIRKKKNSHDALFPLTVTHRLSIASFKWQKYAKICKILKNECYCNTFLPFLKFIWHAALSLRFSIPGLSFCS